MHLNHVPSHPVRYFEGSQSHVRLPPIRQRWDTIQSFQSTPELISVPDIQLKAYPARKRREDLMKHFLCHNPPTAELACLIPDPPK